MEALNVAGTIGTCPPLSRMSCDDGEGTGRDNPLGGVLSLSPSKEDHARGRGMRKEALSLSCPFRSVKQFQPLRKNPQPEREQTVAASALKYPQP